MTALATAWAMYDAPAQDPLERWLLTYMSESTTSEGLYVPAHHDARDQLVLDVADRVGASPAAALSALRRLAMRGVLLGVPHVVYTAVLTMSMEPQPRPQPTSLTTGVMIVHASITADLTRSGRRR